MRCIADFFGQVFFSACALSFGMDASVFLLFVSGVSVCIFVALYVGMFVARANKVEGTMS